MNLPIVFMLTLCAAMATANLPGFQIKLTKKGLDYANTVAHTFLAQELKTLKIPDQNGKDGHIEYSLTGIQNRGCVIPSSSMTFTPGSNGLSWSIGNLGISLHADWRVKYRKGWFKVSTSGSVDASVKSVSVLGTIHLAAQAGGRPAVSLAACSASIGSVDVDFHGGTAWILNLFRGTIEHKIRDIMQDEICKVVTKEINIDANKKLSEIKVEVEIDNRFLLNYSLTSAPQVHVNDIETQHKGETFWKGDQREAPFSPKPIPALADESRMLYLWVSDYMANSFAYSAELHEFLQYNLTQKDFPSANSSYLNTTCKLACIGKLIPQIGQKFPDAQVEAHLKTLAAPHLSIEPKGMTLTAAADVELYARTQDKQSHFIISLNVKLSMSVKGAVVNERLTGEITGHSVNIAVVKSAIGTVHEALLNLIINGALDLAVIPKLNSVLKQGVDIPVTGAVAFQNTQLTLLDGCALIATDLKYQKMSSSLKVVSENDQ